MKFGVVGAGQMGAGIAQVAASSGFEVVLRDVEERFLERGRGIIEKSLDKFVEKGKLEDTERHATLARIQYTTSLEDFAGCDLVVEAILENKNLKLELFQNLGQIVKSSGILASNTSSIPITELATASGRPAQFIGMHFMNPVPLMALVEVIRVPGTVFQAGYGALYQKAFGTPASLSGPNQADVGRRYLMVNRESL